MPDPVKSLTIDQLYEAYMDIGEWGEGGLYGSQEFAHDIYDWFGAGVTGMEKDEWSAQYGMYLPTYDPTATHLAAQERELDYRDAENVYNLATDISNQVYATAVGDVSASVATDLDKSRQIAGGLGLRTGGLETATADATRVAQNKVRELGDNLKLKKTEDENTYNNVMLDSTLDYDKAEHQTKSEFYDRTLAMINKLTDIGAFDKEEGVCNMQCTENCAPPLICNHCTGECQIGETPPGWEAQIGVCTEGMELSGCETHGDKCFCPEVIADQAVTTDVDAFGCACSKDVEGRIISCSDVDGNNCEPDWSTSGSWCDQHNDDCNDPASCKYPCGEDTGITIPSEFSLEGYGCSKVYPDCSWWDDLWGNCDPPTCYYQFNEVSCDSSVCTGG